MESVFIDKLRLDYEPIGVIFANEKPEDSLTIESTWADFQCVISAIPEVVVNKKTFVFSKETCGCLSAEAGFGFGNPYNKFPGGEKAWHYFLSEGNENWEQGQELITEMGLIGDDGFSRRFRDGVGFIKTAEHASKFVDNLPIQNNNFKYLIFKPFSEINTSKEELGLIIFIADIDQLTGLSNLVNYDRFDNDGVIMPRCTACQSIGIYPMREMQSETPRGVVGLIDATPRVFFKRFFKKDYLFFTVPYKLYENMEKHIDVKNNFLDGETWQNLMELKTQ